MVELYHRKHFLSLEKDDPRLTKELCDILGGEKWRSLHLTSLLTLVINNCIELRNPRETERRTPYIYSTLINFFQLSKIDQNAPPKVATIAITKDNDAPSDPTVVPLNGSAAAGKAFQLIASKDLNFQNMLQVRRNSTEIILVT